MTEARELEVSIDLGSRTPPFEQIRAQIAALVHAGSLTEGDRLPTVRALAADLGVAAGTVARAYSELETDGLVVGRRRFGTTVTRAGTDPAQARLQAAANRLIAAALADGLARDDVLAAVRSALDERS